MQKWPAGRQTTSIYLFSQQSCLFQAKRCLSTTEETIYMRAEDEQTYESRHVRAQEEHTYERTHMMREHRKADRGACAAETHTDRSQEPMCVEIYRENAGPQAQKSHFVWKFTGKMPDPNSGNSILCAPAKSKRTWTSPRSHYGNLQENAAPASDHLDWTPGLLHLP